jgi:hypothetical protein
MWFGTPDLEITALQALPYFGLSSSCLLALRIREGRCELFASVVCDDPHPLKVKQIYNLKQDNGNAQSEYTLLSLLEVAP